MKIIHINKQARHDYQTVKKFSAGIVLEGWEVKSVKSGAVSLKEAHVSEEKGELFIYNMHINKWKFSNPLIKVEESRKRKLLLHKREIGFLFGKAKQKGYTIVPLQIFEDRGNIKVEIALAKGLKEYEKREKLKIKDMERSIRSDF